MEQSNIFHKGIVSGLDYSRVQNDQWVFPSQNIRIINREGKGLIVSLLKGVEKEFSLSEGYECIGAVAFDQIIYVVSYSITKRLCEIGCYPSPASYTISSRNVIIPNDNTGFIAEYKLLPNLFDQATSGGPDVRLPFRTNLLPYNQHKILDILAVPSYDESIDLIICDGVNANKIINTGFDKAGGLTTRTITRDDFTGAMDLVKTSDQYPVVDGDVKLNNGGRLLPGNYFLFVRYSTFDFNRTQFLSSIGPISVFNNDRLGDVEGEKYDIPTTKKIDLDLAGLDQSYEYYEIGIVRYFGELGYLQRDVYLLGNKYSTRETNLVITGHEDQQTLDFAEVANHQGIEKISKTHRIINNRYFGANWTGLNANFKTLAELSLLIKLRFTLTEKINDVDIDQLEDSLPEIANKELFYGYKSLDNVIEKAGYRRGAIVPFGVQFILNDDTRTPAFPVTGYDCYNGSYLEENQKGLLRFPFYSGAVAWPPPPVNDITNVLGVRYEMDAFNDYFDKNGLVSIVKGVVFVRGAEIENLLYQGIAGQMINGAINDIPNSTPEHNMCFPLMQTHIPILLYYTNSLGTGEDYADARYGGFAVTGAPFGVPNSINRSLLYMYSPDLLLSLADKTFVGRKYYMQIIGTTNADPTYQIRKTETSLMPNEYARDIRRYVINPMAPVAVETIIVDRGSNPQFGSHQIMSRALPGQFINLLFGNDATLSLTQNRTMVSPRFMAIQLPYEMQNATNQTNYLVNIYSEDPTLPAYFQTIVNSYNAFNNNYSPFYAPIIGSEKFLLPSFSLFGGNSFQTRMYLRQSHWESLYDISEERGDDNPNHHYFAHGLLLGMFVESLVNPAYRHGDMENTYYPKLRLQKVMDGDNSINGNALQWIRNKSDFYIYESFFYNNGYSKSIVDSLIYGYDPAIPFMRKRYPGRIRASAKHNDNSFMSGYSLFSPSNYVDFDKQIGEINYLGVINDELVSISENRIIQHYVDERAIQTEDSGTNLILGHGPIISDQYKVLAEFGSQHKNGIKNCGDNIYGVDVRSKIIWAVTGATSQYGRLILGANPISTQAMIESEIDHIFNELGIVSSKVTPFADNPIIGDGIMIGYDPLEKEVYIIFKKGTDLRGLVYSEKLNEFTGSLDNVSPYFIHDKDNAFSYFNGSFYRHNKGELRHDGERINQIISFIVNGTTAEQSTMVYPKIFESSIIEMPNINLDSIDYETEDQTATKDPFNSGQDNYDDPVYENNTFAVPVILSQTGGNQYLESSEMMGAWLKITLRWKANNNIFIRSIRTIFNLIKP